MNTATVTFCINNDEVLVNGYPELDGCKGFLNEDGIALFFGKGGEFHIANTITGNIRKISAVGGKLVVDDHEIDYCAIAKECPNGIQYAERKFANYARVNTWDGFKGGLCAISWMLYPDGMYFADSDGYGIKDNDEENVYAIINTDLEIVEPFRPIKDVTEYLKEKRADNLINRLNKNTMRTRIFNLIIIDESGSMCSIKKEAIDSVNETIQTIRSAQKKHEGQEHFVSLVTFNDDVKIVYDCVNVNDVKELNADTYRPDCCTALYDAMGFSLNALRRNVADNDNVLVTIVTDGYENASREYSGQSIKALVDELKASGWVFAYIGANQDVEKVAASMSITNTMCFDTTHEGTVAMGKKLNKARSRFYACMAAEDFCAQVANKDFFATDEK